MWYSRLNGFIPHHGCSVHNAVKIAVIKTGEMLGAAVIPDRHIAVLPVPADKIFRLCAVFKQERQQCITLFGLNSQIRLVKPAVTNKPFFPGDRMGSDQRMTSRREIAAGFFQRGFGFGLRKTAVRKREADIMFRRQAG